MDYQGAYCICEVFLFFLVFIRSACALALLGGVYCIWGFGIKYSSDVWIIAEVFVGLIGRI